MAEEAQAPKSEPRLLRIWYGVLQSISLSVLVALCWVTRKFEDIFKQLGMTDLPPPTEGFIALGKLVGTPAGSGAVALLLVTLLVLASKGVLDRWLKKLIWLNILGTFGLTGFMTLSIFLPIIKIQEALRDK